MYSMNNSLKTFHTLSRLSVIKTKKKSIHFRKKTETNVLYENINIGFSTLHPCMSKDVQRLCLGQVRPKGSTSCT